MPSSNDKSRIIFVHSGTSGNTVLLIERIRFELGLDLEGTLHSIDEVINVEFRGSKN